MSVAKKIAESSCRSSWIREMFEEGARLAEIHGCDKVFDFSIGNPNLEPPEEFQRVLEELVADRTPGRHGYMSNAGYPETRVAVAAYLSSRPGRGPRRAQRGHDRRRRRRPQRDPQGHPRSRGRGHRADAVLRGVRVLRRQPRRRAQAGAQHGPTSTWTSTRSRRPSAR